MANGGKVIYQFIGDKTNLESTMKSIGSSFSKLGSTMINVVGTLTKALGGATVALTTFGVNYNATMETYQAGLETLLGSSEQAIKTMNQIKEDARTTPFDVSGLTQANRLLISTGISAEEARETILALGDAVSASGGGNDELQRMAVNLQQIKNAGKATALDIRQFAYAGINVYQLLADYLGKTTEEVKDMEISYEDLSGALKKASKEGGKYFNAMNKQSKTLKGQISNLKDGFSMLAGSLSEPVFNYIKDNILPGINDEIDNLNTMIGEKGIGGTLQYVMDKIIKGIPGVIDKAVMFIDEHGVEIIDKIVEIVSGLAEAIIPKLPAIFNSLLELTIRLVDDLGKELPTLVPMIAKAIVEMLGHLVEHLPEILGALGSLATGLLAGLEEIAGGDGQAFYKAFVGGIENGYTEDEDFWSRMQTYYENHQSVFSTIGTTLGDWLYKYFTGAFVDGIVNFNWEHPLDSFINGARDMFQRRTEKLIEIGKKIIKWIVQGILQIDWDGTANGLINGLANKIKEKSPTLYNIGKSIGKGVLGAVNKVLGIHSPSTEFEWVAQMSVQGYEEGIEKAKSELNKTLNGVFGLSPTMVNNASANLSPNIVVNNVNNISMKQDPLGQMVNDIKNFSGGAKNDYNYGQV